MEEKKSRSQVVTILKALSRNRMAVLGLVILIILFIYRYIRTCYRAL